MIGSRSLSLAERIVGPLSAGIARRTDTAFVLLFHRISPEPDHAYPPLPPAEFEAICEWLKSQFEILPVGELVDRIRRGRSLRGCGAVTFDDGFRDFRTYAYPILKRTGITAAHFLVADSVSTGRPHWNIRLNRIVQARTSKESDGRREIAILKERLAPMSPGTRDRWLAEHEAEARLPDLSVEMLGPEDFSEMDEELVTWGSHTVSHACLGELPVDEARHELVRSRERLREILDREVEFVSYPNNSYSEETLGLAREASYRGTFAVDKRRITSSTQVYAIPRFDINVRTARFVRLETTGVGSLVRDVRDRLNGGEP